MEISSFSIDSVCRTCLCANNDSLETIYNDDEQNFTTIIDMLNQTFGKIVYPATELPQKVCIDCQKLIQNAHNFKLNVQKSTKVLIGKLVEKSDINLSFVEDKNTQTDSLLTQANKKIKFSDATKTETLQFDDENFDSINLQSEDSIFDSQINPLLESSSTIVPSILQSVRVKTEQHGVTDDEYELTGNQPPALILVKAELNEDLSCDMNPFCRTEENEDKTDTQYKIHNCDQCNKCFSRATHLKRHKLTHEEGKIQCSVCDKRFTRIDHLNIHIATNHSDTKPYQCGIAECKKGFIKQEYLRKHIEAKHGSGTKEKEVCDICQKTFSSKKYLRTHMKSHSGDSKSLICKYCNIEFVEKSELNDHMSNEHQNEKPYLCSECGLRFVRNDYLVIHMRRHMGVKPYKCRFCEKGFPRATDLTVHERYHTNEKTHLCNLCGKGFQRAYNLLVHMRVHTGEKPYQCSFCNKSFSQGNDLKAHIRRHTGERFKCDLCNEGFIQGYHLTHHKRIVHGLDVKSHIRRVEKFVAPVTQAEEEEKHLPEENEEI